MRTLNLTAFIFLALSLVAHAPALANVTLPDAGGCGEVDQNTCAQWGSAIEDYCYDPFHNIDAAYRPSNRPVRTGSCSYWNPCSDGYSCVDRNWWGSGTCEDSRRFYQEGCSDAEQCEHGNVDMACYQLTDSNEKKCVLDEEVQHSPGQPCSCVFSFWECRSNDCNGHYCTPNSRWEFSCDYKKDTGFFGQAWDYFVNDDEDGDKNNCPF